MEVTGTTVRTLRKYESQTGARYICTVDIMAIGTDGLRTHFCKPFAFSAKDVACRYGHDGMPFARYYAEDLAIRNVAAMGNYAKSAQRRDKADYLPAARLRVPESKKGIYKL